MFPKKKVAVWPESKMAAKNVADNLKCPLSQKLSSLGNINVLRTNRNMYLKYPYAKFQGHTRSSDDVIGHVTYGNI